MSITVSYENSTGQYVARCGQDFVYSHSAKSAEAKLRHTLKKGPTNQPWIRRRSIRDQSLQSRYIRHRV